MLVAALVSFALLDATRGTPVSRVTARGGGAPPAVTDPLFRCTLEAYIDVLLRPGHAIELLQSGDQTYPRLWADIRGARRFVAMQMYYAKPGRVADELHAALVDRARAGVEVLFLHDAFGSSLKDDYLDSLRAAGVEVAKFRAFSPFSLHTVIHRAHVRAIVIDGEVGWTGGFGIDDKWLGDGRRKGSWRDTNVRFTGPAVAQLLSTFASCWAEATGELIAGTRWWSAAARAMSGAGGPSEADDGSASERGDERGDASEGTGVSAPVSTDALAAILHATPSIGSTAAERLCALTLSGARERLWVTNAYFVPDDDFRRLMREAAQRGADVRVLTAGPSSDVKSTWLAARARYEELLAGGVRIWEYRPDMIHAKTMTVDGAWGMVGTMNLDNRSMAFNDECNLIVQDAAFAEALERMYLADLALADEVDLETFRRRPWWNRPLELGAHWMSRLL